MILSGTDPFYFRDTSRLTQFDHKPDNAVQARIKEPPCKIMRFYNKLSALEVSNIQETSYITSKRTFSVSYTLKKSLTPVKLNGSQGIL